MSTEANNATNTETPVEEAVLPSDNIVEETNPYDLSAFKGEDGKLAGKFDNAEALMKSYNEAQEYIQKINAEKARDGIEKVKAEHTQQTEQQVSELESRLTQEYVNGQVTDETITAAKEAGFSDEKIKLMEYQAKESISTIVEHVGSMDNFNQIKATLAESLSNQEKIDFNNMIGTNAGSEIALLGLLAKYNQISGQAPVSTDRVRGSAATETVRGYQSQAEMMADLAHLRANPNNKSLQAAYEAKKAVTSNDVFYGKR